MKVKKWELLELCIVTTQYIKNPFWDIKVKANFTQEALDIKQEVLGFYDGLNENKEHVWKIRWTPCCEGNWFCSISSEPMIDSLSSLIKIEVEKNDDGKKGFLRAYPKVPWGFKFDNGDPYFLFGDTIYNLFGAKYNGVDVEQILRHRKAQGINHIRARAQVSFYHPGVRNQWQTRDCWPWAGSAQWPDFTRLNIEYFNAIDQVLFLMENLDMGLEMIFEAWMLEFPFNNRHVFLPEHEEFWFEYIIARYSAFPAIRIWTPANEYEFYPGEVKYHIEADRWLKKLARYIRKMDQFKHPIGAHNWVQNIPLHERLKDCEEIDVYLVQSNWGKEMDEHTEDLSLCKYIEEQLRFHSPYRDKAVICSEFGYERVDGCYTAGGHERMDHNHTRRGQWRTGFSGYTIIHGFNNTWGAHLRIDIDAKGASYLLPYYQFMTEEIQFSEMKPSPELFFKQSGDYNEGTQPLCLADVSKNVVSVYFPTRGECTLRLENIDMYRYYWVDPRTGRKSSAKTSEATNFSTVHIEGIGASDENIGNDWVLVLKRY